MVQDKLQSELENDNKWITANLNQYLAPGKKRELIYRWADNLEKLHEIGIFKESITTIAGHIKNHLKESGNEHALPYVREVLPPKYKEMKYSHTDYQSNELQGEVILSSDSSIKADAKVLLADDCKRINANYALRLTRTIEILQGFRSDLLTDVILEPEIPEKEMEEYFLLWDAAIKRCREVRDGREKVLPSTQHLLHYTLTLATLNHAYSKYVALIREFANITAKQAGKILKGRVTHVENLYNPKSRLEARYAGYYGTPCQHCEGYDDLCWRVDFKYNSDSFKMMLYCYRCGKWDEVKTEKLQS